MKIKRVVVFVILFLGLFCIVTGSYFLIMAPSFICCYDEVIPGSHELNIARKGNNFGYINNRGKIVIPLDYKIGEEKEILNYFHEKSGVIPIAKNKKYGLINENGDILIPFKYDFISVLDSNRVIVVDNNQYFLKDINDRVIAGPYMDLESYNSSKVLIARSDHDVKLIDENGKSLMEIDRPGLISYTVDTKNNQAYLFVYANNQYTLFKAMNGNINKIPLVFSNLNFYVYDDVIYVYDETGTKLYNLDGKLLKEYSVTLVSPFENAISFFKSNNYDIGVVDLDGTLIKEAIYSNEYYLNLEKDGFFVLSKIVNNQVVYGIFDSQGREIFPFQELKILDIIGKDYIVCSKNKKISILDFNGNIVRTYDSLNKITNNMYKIGSGNKFGIINNKLQLLLPIDYDWIYYNNSFLYVQKNNQFKILSSNKISD